MYRLALAGIVFIAGCQKSESKITPPIDPPSSPVRAEPVAVVAPTPVAVAAPEPVQAVKPAAPVGPKRVNSAEEGAILDGVKVRAIPATIAEHDYMILLVTIETDDDTRKIDYRSWRTVFGIRDGVQATDNFGNQYRQPSVPDLLTAQLDELWAAVARKSNMGYGSGAVSAASPRTDLLFIEKPIARAEYIDLDLSGRNVGVKEPFRFRLSKDFWTPKPKTPKPNAREDQARVPEAKPEVKPEPKPEPPPITMKTKPGKSKPVVVKPPQRQGPVISDRPNGPTLTLKPLALLPIPLAKDGTALTAWQSATERKDAKTLTQLTTTGSVQIQKEPLDVVVVARLKESVIVWVESGPLKGQTFTVPAVEVPAK